MDIGNSIYITIAIVVISVLCTIVVVAAGIAIPLIIRRNNQKKAEALLATGKQGEATILSLEDTGMLVNNNPRVRMLLEVRIPGHSPYQVQKTLTIPMIRLAQVQVGSVVAVMADPTQPNNPNKVGLLLK